MYVRESERERDRDGLSGEYYRGVIVSSEEYFIILYREMAKYSEMGPMHHLPMHLNNGALNEQDKQPLTTLCNLKQNSKNHTLRPRRLPRLEIKSLYITA